MAFRWAHGGCRLRPTCAGESQLAFVRALSALTCGYIGEPDICPAAARTASRPRSHRALSVLVRQPVCHRLCDQGEYEQAAIFGRRIAKARPEFVNGDKLLIAPLGHLGQREGAKP
jgi:hypothetical protein